MRTSVPCSMGESFNCIVTGRNQKSFTACEFAQVDRNNLQVVPPRLVVRQLRRVQAVLWRCLNPYRNNPRWPNRSFRSTLL